jgi:hypothetical protein
MVTKAVKGNVTYSVTKSVKLWEQALADAQLRLEQARQEIASWKGAIQICRKRIAQKAPWPGE